VVAHRPSALHAMDDLLVLANGQMAALGTRDEIMKKVSGKHPTPPPAQVQSTGQKIIMQMPPTGTPTRN
jgi:ABC-type protease/lipase transport system fused ATPase/permease subunit